jgi:hypothetical protein
VLAASWTSSSVNSPRIICSIAFKKLEGGHEYLRNRAAVAYSRDILTHLTLLLILFVGKGDRHLQNSVKVVGQGILTLKCFPHNIQRNQAQKQQYRLEDFHFDYCRWADRESYWYCTASVFQVKRPTILVQSSKALSLSLSLSSREAVVVIYFLGFMTQSEVGRLSFVDETILF